MGILLLLASQVWAVGFGVVKRRVWSIHHSCVKKASVNLELERESVLGAYCLRAAGKRGHSQEKVSRTGMGLKIWAELTRLVKGVSGYWGHTVFTYHPALDSRDKWRVRDGVPASREFLCLCIQRLQFFIQSKPSLLQCAKTFFHPTESSREVADWCLHMYLILVVLPSVHAFKIFGFQVSFVCFPDEFLLIF